jgi:hypothetical protein
VARKRELATPDTTLVSTPSAMFSPAPSRERKQVSNLISIRLSTDLLERLAHVGREEGLAMSDTIRLVLERGLAAKGSGPRRRST